MDHQSCLDPTNVASLRSELVEAGYGYGDADEHEERRLKEYPMLADTVYLDYAASPPAPPAAVSSFLSDMTSTLYSNPHSRSTSSAATSIAIDRVRGRVLTELCGLSAEASKQWDVIFTSGTTAAIKLVGDAFPWRQGPQARLRYLKQSHTSLVGLRGLALANGAQVDAMEVEDMLAGWPVEDQPMLAAYPAQCNATGARLGLELGRRIKQASSNTVVLLDAAAYLSTSVLDLGSVPIDEAPDFVACSFYKICGWPTGLGALIVKRSSAHLLTHDAYFGGGTVAGLSTSAPFWVARRRTPGQNPPVHDRLEAGTLPFLDIISLGHALDTHRRLYTSHSAVSAHASSLAIFASHQLSLLRHANGSPVVKQHKSLSLERPGATSGFSLLSSTGSYVGHVNLDRLATINGFQLRTGGLCNTGAWASAMGMEDEDLRKLHEKGRACWDDEEFDDQQRPLGIARISFGASSQMSDVVAFIGFIERFFVDSEATVALVKTPSSLVQSSIRLERVTVYPIKSCAGQSVSAWEIAPTGLAYDREWMVVDPRTGSALSQKRWPRMVLIRPRIDLFRRTLTLNAPGMDDLVLPLASPPSCSASTSEARLCGDTVTVSHVSYEADEWFSTFLDTPCELHRFSSDASSSSRHGHFEGPPQPLLLSNESPFLLISSSSTRQVNEWIKAEGRAAPIEAACFRANFQLSEPSPKGGASVEPFFEDSIDLVQIGDEFFQALGPCRRCLMVSIDQKTGMKTSEPFSTLARKRKTSRCRINFGTHLIWREDLSTSGGRPVVREGDSVVLVS